MTAPTSARTYNQDHIPRKYTPGKRRMSIYWTWSYPWESQRDPAAMENRFSTMTEVRTALWPAYETPEWSAAQFLQGIAGTLELFHRSTLSFQRICRRGGRPSGRRVPTYRPGGVQAADRRTHTRGRGHANGVRTRPYSLRARGGSGGNCGNPRMAEARRHLLAVGAPPRRRLHR